SLEQKKAFQVTDGMSDSRYPTFDRNGKYVYFTASTDMGLSAVGFDMSSNEHPVTRSAYVVVLDKDLPSPLAPESDDERIDKQKPKADAEKNKDDKNRNDKNKDAKAKEKPVTVKIDAEGIGQRILALPVPARNYVWMLAGKSGILFLGEAPLVVRENDFEN